MLCVYAGICFSATAFARTTAEIARVFDAGITAYDAGKYADAYKLWNSIRTRNCVQSPPCCSWHSLSQGPWRQKDSARAEEMFERAADAASPPPRPIWRTCCEGQRRQPDPKRALPLLQAAAAANHPIVWLGQLYEGICLSRNVDQLSDFFAACPASRLYEELRIGSPCWGRG